MAKKRKRKRQSAVKPTTVEDRRAEVVTVAWMLSAMATFGAELVGGFFRVILGAAESPTATLLLLPQVMLFAATATGLVCLVLTPIVYRLRRVPPPSNVTALAVTIAVIPFAIGIAQTLR